MGVRRLKAAPPPLDETVRALIWDRRIRAMAPIMRKVDLRAIANADGSPSTGFALIANEGYRRHGGIAPADPYAVARALLMVCTTADDELIKLWPSPAWTPKPRRVTRLPADGDGWAFRLADSFASRSQPG